jgi:hypothetical protein
VRRWRRATKPARGPESRIAADLCLGFAVLMVARRVGPLTHGKRHRRTLNKQGLVESCLCG